MFIQNKKLIRLFNKKLGNAQVRYAVVNKKTFVIKEGYIVLNI